jgi:hypothetical protein
MVDIDIEEVGQKWKNSAKNEIEFLFGKFDNLKVVFTKNFDNFVEDIFKEKGLEYSYSSMHIGGEVVVCKTMHYPSNNQLKTCLIINGNSSFFSEFEDGVTKVNRFHCLLHEREHILLDKKKYVLSGHDKFFSEPKTKTEIVFELAHDVSNEYLAERNAITILLGIIDGDSSDYFISLSKRVEDVLLTYLKSFPRFLKINLTKVKTRRANIKDVWWTIYLATRDTLNLLALNAAHCDALPSISSKFNKLKENQTYSQVFNQTWNPAKKILKGFFESQKFEREKMMDIALKFENIFLSFGIELFDSHSGLIVKVSK